MSPDNEHALLEGYTAMVTETGEESPRLGEPNERWTRVELRVHGIGDHTYLDPFRGGDRFDPNPQAFVDNIAYVKAGNYRKRVSASSAVVLPSVP
jgi:hypothetical protein